MPLRISNRDARRLWLDCQGLSATPTGPLDVLGTIEALGFVQLDTIRAVSRAHHHILWSRNQNYREPMLWKLLGKERAVFEHFTHDASILPMASYPWWRRQFARLGAKTAQWEANRGMPKAKERAEIRARIEAEGPIASKHFDTKAPKTAMWDRPPHKFALDHMWYAGELATSHRENFAKYYDIAERVIPDDLRATAHPEEAQIDWLCRGALTRLGFASEGDIKRFWEAATLDEVKQWCAANADDLVDVEIECADRSIIKARAPADIEDRLAGQARPTSRLRILNPFDPVIRDRLRLERLFGFEYRIEIFVPAAKRRWGYYVYPLLEGDRMVGRIEAKADRKAGTMDVIMMWPEPGVKWGAARWDKLDAELARLDRLAEVRDIVWSEAAQRVREG